MNPFSQIHTFLLSVLSACSSLWVSCVLNDNTGSPNYLKKPAFLVYICIIGYHGIDLIFNLNPHFLVHPHLAVCWRWFLRSLPLKLMSGLVALFVSIISMMIAFSSAFFITYSNGSKWVPNFISVLAFIPIPVFIFLQFPLWSDIVYSAYICSSLFRPSKRMIH